MQIRVNGEMREVPAGITVATLLETLQLGRFPCAVERNQQVVPREAQDRTPLEEGDRLEIVTFVGGG